MKYLIGLPIYKRSWILPTWFKCLENQSVSLKDMGFLFLTGSQEQDPETFKILFDWQAAHPEVPYFDIIEKPAASHKHHLPGIRAWRQADFRKMANFRNELLERTCRLQPENYLSLDSDILFTDPLTIETLTSELPNFNAVSPLMYMSPKDKRHPNILSWKNGNVGCETQRCLDRYPLGTTFQAEVIMAAVLMDPEAYTKSRYRYHPSGEDVGWAYSMWRNKLTMGMVSGLYAPHIMHQAPAKGKEREFENAPGVWSAYQMYGDNRFVTT